MVSLSTRYFLVAGFLLSQVVKASPMPNPDPRVVYVTQTQPTEFTTIYNFNTATIHDTGDVVYSTDWNNAQPIESTVQPAPAAATPETETSSPAAAVETSQPPAAIASSSPAAVETSSSPAAVFATSSPAPVVASSPAPVVASSPAPVETSSSAAVETSSPAAVAATSSPAAVETSSSSPAAAVVPTTTSTSEAAPTTTVAATSEAATPTPEAGDTLTYSATAAPGPSGTVVSGVIPSAIVYSPYQDDGSCKDADTVLSDLKLISSKKINNLRIYATDCNSLETVQPAALSLGMKISQGMWMSNAGVDSIDDQVSAIIAYGEANGWDIFTNLIVANEAILQNYCSVSELLDKASSVISKFRAAGYQGDILTAEPPASYEKNPALCTSGVFDAVGINSHSYYDPNSAASDAGSFVKGQLAITKGVCNVPVIISETGYPSAGDVYGKNIPTAENQAIAIKSLLEELNGDITVLTTYNDYWKNPGPNNIEQHFGVIQLLE